jgi:hypothetical protein
VSRGEERIFVWCLFLALFEVEGWADKQSSHFFIDDPVSSLDDHNIFITAATFLDLIESHFDKRKEAGGTSGKIYGQEYNVTTYNLARMNMLLHGVKDTEFEIYHGDTLTNAWDFLRETNPAKKPQFDAVVANPPFSYRWEPTDAISEDMRFKSHGVAPKSAADLAFLLHGLHYLKDDGVMAIYPAARRPVPRRRGRAHTRSWLGLRARSLRRRRSTISS